MNSTPVPYMAALICSNLAWKWFLGRLRESLDFVEIPDLLRRQRWFPTSPKGQYAGYSKGRLNQQAQRDDQRWRLKSCDDQPDVKLLRTTTAFPPCRRKAKQGYQQLLGYGCLERRALSSGIFLPTLLCHALRQKGSTTFPASPRSTWEDLSKHQHHLPMDERGALY